MIADNSALRASLAIYHLIFKTVDQPEKKKKMTNRSQLLAQFPQFTTIQTSEQKSTEVNRWEHLIRYKAWFAAIKQFDGIFNI